MGWKTLADFLRETEDPDIARTPGSAIRMAREVGLIENGDAWLEAGKTRNVLAHEYSLASRDEGLRIITLDFLQLCKSFDC